jgi:hypothetical protein
MRKNRQPVQESETSPLSFAEEIAKLAYSYWQADGCPEGSDMRYWLRAESEVLAARGLPLPDELGFTS